MPERAPVSCLMLPWMVVVLLALPGCGQSKSGGGNDAELLDELFADLDVPQESVATETRTVKKRTPRRTTVVEPESVPVIAPSASEPSFPLPISYTPGSPLNLPVQQVSETAAVAQPVSLPSLGERLGLIKTVEQTLYHKSPAQPFTMKTRLELHMQIHVEYVQNQAVLLRLGYTRVRYSREGAGHSIQYDSDRPATNVPPEVMPYTGLRGNGFAFWMNGDHTVGNIVGYEEFVGQCTAGLPEPHQQAVATSMAANGSEVVSFIDQTVGLLPRRPVPMGSSPLGVGDTWVDERPIVSATPVSMMSTCKVTTATPEAIELEVIGRVLPQITSSAVRYQPPVRVIDGSSRTSCTIDRSLGLPTALDRHVTMSMVTTSAAGESVAQEKHVQTTIVKTPIVARPVVHATPPAYGSPPAVNGGLQPGTIQQTSALQPAPNWR